MNDLCLVCKKALINIHRSKRLCDRCLDNASARTRKYYLSHKEKVKIHAKEYVNKNKEKVTIRRKKYRQDNLEKIKNREKKWRDENYVKISIQKKEWRKNNFIRNSLIEKQYREKHAEHYKELARIRRKRDRIFVREQGIIDSRKRRAIEYNLLEHYTLQDWKECLVYWNHRCVNCGSLKDLEADHIVPISRGGSDTIDNIQPLCQHCNRTKHAKTIDYRWECT